MNGPENGNPMDQVVPALLKKAGINHGHLEILPLQGGNNRVWKLVADLQEYVLKQYFVSGEDNRNRLFSEFNFLECIWRKGIRNVPEPVFCDLHDHMALYGYIEGKRIGIGGIEKRHIIKAMDFIEAVNASKISVTDPLAEKIGMASDFSLKIEEYVTSVDKRINRVQSIKGEDKVSRGAIGFANENLIPRWGKIKTETVRFKGEYPVLSEKDMILSPSDFGFHNAVTGENEEIYFMDFEYAGWDDPVKLICDFFCQPEIPVPLTYMDYCINRMAGIAQAYFDLRGKIRLLMPLFRIKWCCIMLNDFLTNDSRRRQFAFFREDRRENQLKKSIAYFDRHF